MFDASKFLVAGSLVARIIILWGKKASKMLREAFHYLSTRFSPLRKPSFIDES